MVLFQISNDQSLSQYMARDFYISYADNTSLVMSDKDLKLLKNKITIVITKIEKRVAYTISCCIQIKHKFLTFLLKKTN